MGRHYVVGDLNKDFAASLAKGAELNKFAGSMMKPGVSLGEIVDATEQHAAEIGVELKRACWMHGLGAFYYEQYAVDDISHNEPLRDGALLHCHPIGYRYFPELGENVREDFFWLNTYVVTPQGGKLLTELPMEVQVID
jgi:hypothetical protein